MKQSVHAIYRGQVQGVGFRFAVERAAASLGLSGWVKNRRDGGVEVVCEGGEKELKAFLARIQETFAACISDAEIGWAAATNSFEGFDIRFD